MGVTSPTPFSDIGKQAKDLLTKEYNFDHKFTLMMLSDAGMGIITTDVKRDRLFAGNIISAVRWLFGGGAGVVALRTPRWVGGDVYLMCLWFGVVPVMFSQKRLFSVVVDVTMTPEIPLRPISLWVVIADPFFIEVENKDISQDEVVRAVFPSVILEAVRQHGTVRSAAEPGLDGATESQEGICVSFGCHALRLVVILLCIGYVNSSYILVSRIMLTSIDSIFSPYLTAVGYINNSASAGPDRLIGSLDRAKVLESYPAKRDMVGYYFLVPSLLLRVKLWLDTSSWCPDSSGEVEVPMIISFSLVELVQYIVPLYPTISGMGLSHVIINLSASSSSSSILLHLSILPIRRLSSLLVDVSFRLVFGCGRSHSAYGSFRIVPGWGLDNPIVIVHEIFPCTKARLSFKIPDHKSGKLDLLYLHPHAAIISCIGLIPTLFLEGSTAIRTKEFSLGGEVVFDTSTASFTKYNA
ncbi:hypothetical protein GIB67_039506 [Kingdonia uniflora]|uniref:Uncharacterized protein n=1 Tax=Kingdonia uniflora TaxID=39325 RepID=A0A7J7LJ19_9MAGN|nr:hypothetical protein GIB67_039506 [Kingdonia uniflora]